MQIRQREEQHAASGADVSVLYKEEGTTTTPFDIAVLNDIDRFHLVKDVVDRVPSLGPRAASLTQIIRDKLIDHKLYIRQYGEDMPEIRNWKWRAK